MATKKVIEELKNVEGRANRSPTGISGFDDLCQGGFLRDSVNLIMGNAGSGKTIFLLQFLYNGFLKYNENGLYVSFEEEIKDLEESAKLLEMDFKGFATNKCQFIKFKPGVTINEIQKEILKKISENDIKRIVFDPINIFSSQLPKGVSLRRQLYEFFELLKQLNICVIVSGESNTGSVNRKLKIPGEITIAKFFSDSVIEFYSSGIGGEGDRAIKILKMRRTKHFRGPVGMEIDDKGVEVLD
jgi:circadian clock protein KaiC